MPTKPTTPSQQMISVPASGAVLDAIRQRALDDDAPLGRTVMTMLTEYMDAALGAALATGQPSPPPGLSDIETPDLVYELLHRIDSSASVTELAAATARADAAERQLAAIGALLQPGAGS